MKKRKPKCERCQWAKDPTQIMQSRVLGVAKFNVGHAELIISKRPRKPIEITVDQIRRQIAPYDVEPNHVGHVNERNPGIMAQVTHVKGVRRVLIEGNHRATKCLYKGKSFKVYVLTPRETNAVIIRKLTPKGKARQ